MFRTAGVALLRGGNSAVRRATGAAAAKKAPAETKTNAARGSAEPLMKKYPVSAELSDFLGAEEATRSEAVSKIWEYIRTHKLQNPEKKSEYLPDATLRKVLNSDVVTFGSISKLLGEHFPAPAVKPKTVPRAKKAPKEKKAAA